MWCSGVSAGSVYRYGADVNAQILVEGKDIPFISKRKEKGLDKPIKVSVVWSAQRQLGLESKDSMLWDE